MTVTTLIVDDERLARANLRAALQDCCDWQVVGECDRGDQVLVQVEQLKPQVIFLDINMPGLSGLEASRALMKLAHPPILVFVTAYDQHAVEAFELCALDYLLKPFDDDRLLQTIRRVESAISSGENGQNVTLWQQVTDNPTQYLDRVAVRSIGKVQLVEVADILWMKSAGNYVELYLADRCILHRVSISFLEQHLDPAKFIRVHRTAIVRITEVVEFLTLADSTYAVTLKNGAEVSVSQRYKEKLLNSLRLAP